MKFSTLLLLGTTLVLSSHAVLLSAETPVGAPAETSQIQPSALADVQATLDAVVAAASKFPGDQNRAARRKQLREVINPRFNFAEMSKRSLGARWTELTEEQRQEFTTTFSELLARTYMNKVETVKPGMVRVDSEKLDFPKSAVKTIVTSKGDDFPIEYRLLNNNGKWQVFDVVIENIGLVANYRNEFAGIIRKDGVDGLIQRLKDKNAAAGE